MNLQPIMSLVSVIIPCYNAERWVAEAVQSCLDQTYKPIEIIVVDDGSTDESLKVLSGFGDRITLETGPNQGGCHARNRGIELSSGQYIQFLDADDMLMPRKIEHQMRLVMENECPDIIIGSSVTRLANGMEVKTIADSKEPWSALARVELGNTCANLWKMSKVRDVRGWDEQLKSSQEYDLLFRLLQQKPVLYFDAEPLTLVRQRDTGSITSSNRKDNVIRRADLLRRIRDYLVGISYKDEIVDIVNTSLFDVVRELCNYDRTIGTSYFHQCFSKSYRPKPSSATGRVYVSLFQFIGFERTQQINRLFKSLKNKKLVRLK